jgi:hypothetical protein
MKNKSLLTISVLIVFLVATTSVNAAKQQGSTNDDMDEVQVQQQGQVSNQVQNQGEDTQIKTQEQEDSKDENETVSSIGQQIKVIAQEQNQSSASTTQAMEKIEKRNKIQTFLLGTDYKNLGALRSEIVQTRNRLDQLDKLIEKAQSESDKTELQNQVKTLEQEQAKIDNFIKAQDGKFSLFGWLVKLFNK